MPNNNIILFGGGGHSLSVADIILHHSSFSLIGFLDKSKRPVLSKLGIIHLGSDNMFLEFDCENFHIAIGQIHNSPIRRELYELVIKNKKQLPVLTSQDCVISKSAEVGAGTLIMHGATINPLAVIGDNSIVNTNATIEHGVQVSNHCHVAPSATVLGDAIIGENCFIGSGAVICQGVNVGEGPVIGAGLIIKQDVKPGTTQKML